MPLSTREIVVSMLLFAAELATPVQCQAPPAKPDSQCTVSDQDCCLIGSARLDHEVVVRKIKRRAGSDLKRGQYVGARGVGASATRPLRT